jgi:mono/diheme cytochrome c family protein
MMAFKDRLSDQEILALVKYVRSFDKKLAGAAAGAKAARSKPAPKAGTR